jgi:adenylate cyclase
MAPVMGQIAVRKVVAVLSADFAGYTGLMERAEIATHISVMDLLRTTIQPAIEAHGGIIVKSTGDGFLARFDAASDAVACSLRIQEHLAEAAAQPRATPLLLRIGINIANAIIEPHDIFGEDVNLAARLQAAAEPGGIVVSASVADQVRSWLGESLRNLGELTLKHISRPVQAYSVATRAPPRFALTIALPLPDDRPSIAVLPFRMLGDEGADMWFADALIEGIVHALSGIEDLFVVGYATSLAYAGKTVDVREVGRDLNVRYVLTGLVRRVAGQMRISAELSATATGKLIRTWHRNAAAPDPFDMHDDLVKDMVSEIAPAVRREEVTRASFLHPDSMTAYDLVLRATNLMYSLRRADFDLARGMFQQAMAYDPVYAPPYAHAAMWHIFRISQGWTESVRHDAEEADRFSTAALERTHSDAAALAIHGLMLAMTKQDLDMAKYDVERAIVAKPNAFIAWTLSAVVHGWAGEGQTAVAHAERALSLSPLDPMAFYAEYALSQGHYVNGDHDRAVAWGRRAASGKGLLASNLRILAAASIALGDRLGAQDAAQRLLQIDPAFTVGRYAAWAPPIPPLLSVQLARLREAGLPD